MMKDDGHQPIMDYALRSEQEQMRLFNEGLSKCDGVHKISKHQEGKALDIYFYVDDEVDYSFKKTANLAKYYHYQWELLGGREMIEWDKPHYES
jgi:hypothetical protein